MDGDLCEGMRKDAVELCVKGYKFRYPCKAIVDDMRWAVLSQSSRLVQGSALLSAKLAAAIWLYAAATVELNGRVDPSGRARCMPMEAQTGSISLVCRSSFRPCLRR